MKTCTKCAIEKQNEDFYKDRLQSSGLTSRCRECIKETTALYAQTPAGKASRERHRRKAKSKREAAKNGV